MGVIPGGGKNGRQGASFKEMEETGRKTSPASARELPKPRPGASKYQKPTAKRSAGRSSGR